MTYGLRRNGQWVLAPEGKGDGHVLPPMLALGEDIGHVWDTPDIELALERSTLLRMCWGWTTEIRAIR